MATMKKTWFKSTLLALGVALVLVGLSACTGSTNEPGQTDQPANTEHPKQSEHPEHPK